MKIFGLLCILFVVGLGVFFFINRNNPVVSEPDVLPSPTVSEYTVQELITQALSEKNKWDISLVELRISALQGDFAAGDVKMKNEMGGGLWFAAKVRGNWNIVYDGNGIITCDQLNEYENFPVELIPKCYDKETNELKSR